jgi:leucyl/phenylalanyl-tRNA---protein transferase
MSGLYWIDPYDDESPFPEVDRALRDPDGLLAVGGNLSPKRLIDGYRRGIFPWYSKGQPILWWSPDPRAVLFPDQLRISRSLRKTLKKEPFRISLDVDFRAVIRACAGPRRDTNGTWITPAMLDAYCRLHDMGLAHSVEAWEDGELVGGLYGVALGRVFFGESMFSHRTDASKVAFVYLVRQLQSWGYQLIDCQVGSTHLESLGAVDLPRRRFVNLLEGLCVQPGHAGPWCLDTDPQQLRFGYAGT